MFGNRCYNGGTRHNFKPRYTEQANPLMRRAEGKFCTASEVRSLMVLRVYAGDVCTWCGKVVNSKEARNADA